MDFFTKGYNALKGEYTQPQSPTDTIARLCDRLESATLLEDRRAAVLSLKGLARQYKSEVSQSLAGMLKVVEQESEDVELTKAAIETINILCTQDRRVMPLYVILG